MAYQSKPILSHENLAVLRKLFFPSQRGHLHIIGCGNPLRSDDAVGIQIIHNLLKKCNGARLSFCKVHLPSLRLESLMSRIDYTKDNVLLLDAVDFGAHPGATIFSSLKGAQFGFFVTHNVPLSVIPGVASHLERIFVWGIQPMNIDVGEFLSAPVKQSADQLVEELHHLMER